MSKDDDVQKKGDSTEIKARKERATHFLCFPISSESKISDLATSIAHFRSISTQPTKAGRRLETTADGKVRVVSEPDSAARPQAATTQNHANDNDPLGNMSKYIEGQKSFSDTLKILPPVAQRAAGTYHLTLGVMDLSAESKMQQAKELLHTLDLRQILCDAQQGPPVGSKEARKWKEPAHREGKEDFTREDEMRAQASESSALPPADNAAKLKTLDKPVSPPTGDPDRTPNSEKLRQLHIALTGLGAFPSSKNARVIWARPREQTELVHDPNVRPSFNDNALLYNFALHLNNIFRREGLITETRPLVLHATVANMRYAVQAKGGRTTKGKSWRFGKQRWKEGLVDARPLLDVFNNFNGEAMAAESNNQTPNYGEVVDGSEDDETMANDDPRDEGRRQDADVLNSENEYLWLANIPIDRVAICKMGATKAESELWGEWYPPIAEKLFSDNSQ